MGTFFVLIFFVCFLIFSPDAETKREMFFAFVSLLLYLEIAFKGDRWIDELYYHTNVPDSTILFWMLVGLPFVIGFYAVWRFRVNFYRDSN